VRRWLNQNFLQSAPDLQTFIGAETRARVVGAEPETFPPARRVGSGMRSWLALIVVGCGANADPTPPPAVPGGQAAAVAPRREVPPPLTGAHGPEIVAVGVTPDGTAAASLDRGGGLRLWPTLDGTREPVVLHATAGKSVAIARSPGGFTVFVVDAAGAGELIQLTAAGVGVGRAPLAGDQPVTTLISTPAGFLILRADQTIELVDPAGAIQAHLVPEPGTHVESIVARGQVALAVVLDGKRARGRRIVLDHGARWGELTAALPAAITQLAISPSGALAAISHAKSLRTDLVELATGKVRDVVCAPRSWPNSSGEPSTEEVDQLLASGAAPVPVAFLTETELACMVSGQLVWWKTADDPWRNSSTGVALLREPFAIFDRGLVVGAQTSLAIATRLSARYLGYALHEVAKLHAMADGALIVGDEQDALVLDGALVERGRVALVHGGGEQHDLRMIDERYGVISDKVGDRYQLALFDGVLGARRQQLPYDAADGEPSYEPATRLLATSDGMDGILVRYDPASHGFGPPARVPSTVRHAIALLDPSLTGGVAALQIEPLGGDVLQVGELALEDLRPGAKVAARATYKVTGALAAVDRAGRLYVRHADAADAASKGEVMIVQRGATIARLTGMGDAVVRPNRDGSRILAFAAPRAAVWTGAGKRLWDTTLWSAAAAEWAAGGELLVQFPTGAAMLAADTGAPIVRRCGWSFGLFPQSPQLRSNGRSVGTICDAAGR
jgi:hypothetical protein